MAGIVSKQNTQRRGRDCNYFLGLRLQGEETRKALVDVQRQVMELYPFYREHVMNKNGFHLTLRLLNLRADAEIRTCVKAMKNISDEVIKYMKQVEPLAFKGLGHFGPSVIFAKVEYTTAFVDLLEFISNKLSDAGVRIVQQDFNPQIKFRNGQDLEEK